MTELKRALGRVESLGILMGTIIGTGVFLKAAPMAQQLGSGAWVLAAWAAAGILSLLGALVYAEIGALFPRSGGEYVFLKEAYGDVAGFLYGWQRFWIGGPGSIAAYAVGTATFLTGVGPLSAEARSFIAVMIIVTFTGLNCLNVKFGGRFQAALTVLKSLMIIGLMLALFSLPAAENVGLDSALAGRVTIGTFSLAMLSALWAFDGWSNLPMAAGEIKHPGRTLPFALVVGTLLVLLLYAGVNTAYFHALPFTEILSSASSAYPDAAPVATKAAAQLMGGTAGVILAIGMAVSAIGAMNGAILTGSRVPFALANDGLMPRLLAKVSPITQVPTASILIQGAVAILLALTGTFDQLTNWIIFAGWIFYFLCGASVFVFRRRLPDAERPYRVPGYPWVPALFCLTALGLLINTVIESPGPSSVGVLFILAGLPAYFLFARKSKRIS